MQEDTPFRRSIWEFDERYAFPGDEACDVDLKALARLQSIEAAKKRTPPIPIAQLAVLAERLRARPDPAQVSVDQFATFLQGLLVYGVGIKTAVCMLAVTSNGEFPPIDKQVADGLRAKDEIDDADVAALNSSSVSRFSAPYVQKVLPAWRSRRTQGLSPQQVDTEWATAGERKSHQ